MASNYWIKLYHEILHDRKMATLSDHLYRRVIELFLLAGEAGSNGELPEPGDIAWELRADEQQVLDDLQELSKIGIVDLRGNSWWVTNFADRQAPVDPEERKARFLERQRKAEYYAMVKEQREQQEQDAPVDEPPAPDAGTQLERNVPATGTQLEPIVDRLDIERLDIDLQKESDLQQKQPEPARAIAPERQVSPAPVESRQPLQVYSFTEPEGVAASGGSTKPPDIRNQCAAAIDYWIQVGKRRGMHDDDKYQIGAMVKSYGWERVKAAMDAEPMGALWNIQKRLMTPQPAEPATVTA